MKKLLLPIVLICALVLSCGKSDPKAIVIGVMPDVDSIPFVIAQKNAYYEGAAVSIEHFKSAKDRDSALQSGRLDGVITDLLAVLFANDGGIKLIVPAKTYGDIKLLTSRSSSIKSLKELKDKKIGLSTNTIMEYTADKMLASAGILSISKAAIPHIPARLEMLNAGKIDVTILPEPLAGLAEKDGALTLLNLEGMSEDISIGVIAFTENALRLKEEQIKALFKGYNRAVDYLASEPQKSYIDFVIKTQGFPENLGDSINLPKYGKAELPSEKNFNSALKWLKDKNLIKGSFEYTDIVDVNFLRQM
ncbi:MAG: ABC transporter substrate-binding protein [Spirochaetia bacterium]|jgi:NitT/TauT family transport system substrate-binding protein|nr:ABC transporter substrate-binding protein [Spirochaetia bacterium]